MSSELRLPNVRISQRNLGEYPDVEVDGVPINGVTEFEFKPPHRLTLVLEVEHLEALRESLRPGPRDASADPEHIRASPAVGEGILVRGSGPPPGTVGTCRCGAPRLPGGRDDGVDARIAWLASGPDALAAYPNHYVAIDPDKRVVVASVDEEEFCRQLSRLEPDVRSSAHAPHAFEGVIVPPEPANVPYVGDGWSGFRKGVVEGLEGTGQFERGSVTAEKVTGDVNAALEKASRQAEETVLVSWTGRGPDGEVLF